MCFEFPCARESGRSKCSGRMKLGINFAWWNTALWKNAIAEVRSASEQGRVQCRLRRENWTTDNILKTCAAAQKQVGASLFSSTVGLLEKLAIPWCIDTSRQFARLQHHLLVSPYLKNTHTAVASREKKKSHGRLHVLLAFASSIHNKHLYSAPLLTHSYL